MLGLEYPHDFYWTIDAYIRINLNSSQGYELQPILLSSLFFTRQ